MTGWNKLYCLLTLLTCSATAIFAQERNGIVKGVNGEAVEFATVALLCEEKQIAVAVTDTSGRFCLSVADGEYRMKIRTIGYEPLDRTLRLAAGNSDIGLFEMEMTPFGLGEVVVTSSPITRQGDRFVILIDDNPALLNKDGVETLQLAPGVWIDDNGVSINGAGGTKVFINEQELKLTQKELASYLRNFRSTDIARIEIIPLAGAEFSADSHGGVIKIALRKEREKGIAGNVMVRTSYGKQLGGYNPSGTLNARIGRWTLNGLASGNRVEKSNNNLTSTRTFYNLEDDSYFRSESDTDGESHSRNGRLGAVYEADKRNSFGVEAAYSYRHSRNPSHAETTSKDKGQIVRSDSDYRQGEKDRNFSAAFNYVHLLDTAGSTLKLITDITDKRLRGENDYHALFEWPGGSTDSIYRNSSSSDYTIFSSDLALNRRLRNGMKYSAGAKYTRNRMSDRVCYESLFRSVWEPLPDYNYAQEYTENIGALYGTFATDIGAFNLSAGLRGEYTRTDGRGNHLRKSYFDLFPHFNATYSFDAMRIFMLIGQYSRNIQRPNFRHLNPNRVQYSDYSYYTGNPGLRPTYIDRFSITAVYKYRYVLSIGGNLHKDLVREVIKTDPVNKEVTYILPENHHTENHYFIALSLPLKFTGWCSLNTNLVGVKQDIRAMEREDKKSHYLYFANLTANFTLPGEFYPEFSYNGTSRLYSANSGIDPRHLFHASLKKQLMKSRLAVSFGINNIFNSKPSYFSDTGRFRVESRGYEAPNSRFVRLSVQYRFKAGKPVKKRTIESASEGEKGRMEKSPE